MHAINLKVMSNVCRRNRFLACSMVAEGRTQQPPSGWVAAAEEAENLVNLRKQIQYRQSSSSSRGRPNPHSGSTHGQQRKRSQSRGVDERSNRSSATVVNLEKRTPASRGSTSAAKVDSPKSDVGGFVRSMCRFYSDIFGRKSPVSVFPPAWQQEEREDSLSVSFTRTTSPQEKREDMAKIVRRSKSFEFRRCNQQSVQRAVDQKCLTLGVPRGYGPRQPRKGGLTGYFIVEAAVEKDTCPLSNKPATGVEQEYCHSREDDPPGIQLTSQDSDGLSSGKEVNPNSEAGPDHAALRASEIDRPSPVTRLRDEARPNHVARPSPQARTSPVVKSGHEAGLNPEARPNPDGQCLSDQRQAPIHCQGQSLLLRRQTSGTRTPRGPSAALGSPEVARDCIFRHSQELSPIGYSELSGQHYLLRLSPEGECSRRHSARPSRSFSTEVGSPPSGFREATNEGNLSHDDVIRCDISSPAEMGERQSLDVTNMSHSPLAPSQDSGFSDSGDSLSEKGGSLPRVSSSTGDSLPRVSSKSGDSLPRVSLNSGGSLPRVSFCSSASLPRVSSTSRDSLPRVSCKSGDSLPRVSSTRGCSESTVSAYFTPPALRLHKSLNSLGPDFGSGNIVAGQHFRLISKYIRRAVAHDIF